MANELGAGSAKAAKFSILVVVTESLFVGILLFAMFLMLRSSLAYVFTESSEVAAAVSDLSPLLAFSILLNSVQPVLSGQPTAYPLALLSTRCLICLFFQCAGVAVGAGWQSVVVYVNVTCYYLVGVPLGVVLGYMSGYQVKVRR